MELPIWLSDAWKALAAVAAACGAGYGLYLKIGKPTIDRVNSIRLWFNNVGEMARTTPIAIAVIQKEMTTNSGSSIKDAINRIEQRGLSTEGILRARIEAAPDVAVYTDADGEITSVTAGYTELTGLDAASCKRERWKEVIHPDDVADVTRQWHESLASGKVFVAEFRFRHVTKRGSHPCRVVTSPVLVGDKIAGWAANITPLGDPVYEMDDEMREAMVHIDPASAQKH